MAHDVLTNRVQEMRLAEGDAAIEEEWIVGFARRCATAKAAACANVLLLPTDKGVKCCFGLNGELGHGRVGRLRFFPGSGLYRFGHCSFCLRPPLLMVKFNTQGFSSALASAS